jgi:hypothetical protein
MNIAMKILTTIIKLPMEHLEAVMMLDRLMLIQVSPDHILPART